MKLHPDLKPQKFDRIIFNFPHAGFYGKEDNQLLIGMHRSLVKDFFRNASAMLRADAEVHVSHKTTAPFSKWNIEELAREISLSLLACPEFKIEDYPGYSNKRGNGSKCDEPFRLGECRTFIFGFSPAGKKKSGGVGFKGFCSQRSQHVQKVPIQVHSGCAGNGVGYSVHGSHIVDSFRHPQTSFTRTTNDLRGYVGLPLASDTQRENVRIYNNRFSSALRRVSNDVGNPVCESVIWSARYMLEASGITRNVRINDGCFNNVDETLRSSNNVSEPLISFEKYVVEAPGRT